MSGEREGPRKFTQGYFGNNETPDRRRVDPRDEQDTSAGAGDEADDYAYDESVLYDELTDRTYYLDEASGAYYYYDEEVGGYVIYDGEDEPPEPEMPYAGNPRGVVPREPRERGPQRPQSGAPRQERAAGGDNASVRAAAQKQATEKKKRRNLIILIAVAVVILAGSVVASVLIFDAKERNTYDAQMRIGVEHYKAGEYAEAEEAFKRALEFKPGDVNATIALADTYTAEAKYERAAQLLEEVKAGGISAADTLAGVMSKLLTLSISHLDNIPRANELILECYTNGIDPQNELVLPAPVFDPAGGSFEETKNVTITASEGSVIYYTKDGTIPNTESAKYESALKLKKSEQVTFTAIAVAENGLYTWPGTAEFAIDIQYLVNSQPTDFIGQTAKTIMNTVGPLYYQDEMEGGLYYKPNDGESVSYIFPWDNSLDVPEPAETADGTEEEITPDPNKHPLKADAVCAAVAMKIGDYVPKVTGTIAAEDLMSGISIKNYKIEKSEEDGLYHLYYSQNALSFDYTLKDKSTASADGLLFVKKK